MDNMKKFRLAQIENEIKKAEEQKNIAIIMMIISIFFLWPLLIIGAIKYNNANRKIARLDEEKAALIFLPDQDQYFTL